MDFFLLSIYVLPQWIHEINWALLVDVIKALAWPVSIVCLVWLILKKHKDLLLKLIPEKPQSLEVGPFKVAAPIPQPPLPPPVTEVIKAEDAAEKFKNENEKLLQQTQNQEETIKALQERLSEANKLIFGFLTALEKVEFANYKTSFVENTKSLLRWIVAKGTVTQDEFYNEAIAMRHPENNIPEVLASLLSSGMIRVEGMPPETRIIPTKKAERFLHYINFGPGSLYEALMKAQQEGGKEIPKYRVSRDRGV